MDKDHYASVHGDSILRVSRGRRSTEVANIQICTFLIRKIDLPPSDRPIIEPAEYICTLNSFITPILVPPKSHNHINDDL